MKKKILFTVLVVFCMALAALAVTVNSDSCGKCKVSVDSAGAVSFTCGKCGGNESTLGFKDGKNWSVTCNSCGHSISISN